MEMENIYHNCPAEPEYGMTGEEQAMSYCYMEQQEDLNSNMIWSNLSNNEWAEEEGVITCGRYASPCSPCFELVDEEFEINCRPQISLTDEWVDAEEYIHSTLPAPPDANLIGQRSEEEAVNIMLLCEEVCCRPSSSQYSDVSDQCLDLKYKEQDVEVEANYGGGSYILRGSQSFELVDEEIEINSRPRISTTGEWVDAEDFMQYRLPSLPESCFMEQKCQVEAPCEEVFWRSPYSTNSNLLELELESQTYETFSTPKRNSTPIILKEYVPTPTSTIRGLRRRRLNFSEEEEEEET